eukprot:scaffold1549_cov350-Prasinococcus_capsulatus_cf.AAC.6
MHDSQSRDTTSQLGFAKQWRLSLCRRQSMTQKQSSFACYLSAPKPFGCKASGIRRKLTPSPFAAKMPEQSTTCHRPRFEQWPHVDYK